MLAGIFVTGNEKTLRPPLPVCKKSRKLMRPRASSMARTLENNSE